MSPTFEDGDVAIVEPVDEYCGFGLYIVDNGGPQMVRVTHADHAFRLTLSSDHPRHGSYQVELSWFREHVLGRVLMRVSSVWPCRDARDLLGL